MYSYGQVFVRTLIFLLLEICWETLPAFLINNIAFADEFPSLSLVRNVASPALSINTFMADVLFNLLLIYAFK